MSDPADPPRFVDPASEAPQGLRELFSSASLDLPSAAELAPLRARLDTALGPGASGGSVLARLGGAKGALAAALGVAALALLALFLVRERPAPPAQAPVSPARNAVPELAAPAPAKPAESPPAAAAPTVGSEPAEPSPSTRRPAATARPSEAALLETARAVLVKQPARALALTRDHARLYPSGVLVQEREVIAIEALRRLGDERGAEERAGQFRRSFPSSPHRRSVDPTQR